MSGFLAILNGDRAPVDAVRLRSMIDLPPFEPSCDVWIDGPFGIACSPLGKRDRTGDHESRSRDAFLSDGRLVIAFDGRLDDRDSLREQLSRHARHDLGDAPDIELLAAAYSEWGSACAQHLLGDFAFCVWDVQRRMLVAARDHFGVKPFFLSRAGGSVILSNVLRAIARHPAVSQRFDDRTVGDLLLFGLGMDPSRTSFADISRLPPAHVATASIADDRLRIERYWALDPSERHEPCDVAEAVDEFASTFRQAVGDRVRGGPVSIFMSGGLDSASIAATAADVLGPTSRTALRAFTGVYETVPEDEERYYSTILAATLEIGIDHIGLDRYAFFDGWDEGGLPPEPTTEPLLATTTAMLTRAARHADVILTGDGGDPLMRPATFVEQIGQVPVADLIAGLWQSRHAGRRPPLGIRAALRRWRRDARIDTDLPSWLAAPLRQSFDARARWLEVTQQRHAHRVPRGAAFSSLTDPWWPSLFEGYDPGATGQPVAFRYPFFDVRLVNVAMRLPSFPFFVNKHVLRRAMRGRLPDVIRMRPKTPLPIAPESIHGKWSVVDAMRALDSAPGIEHYVDRRAFESSLRPADLFTQRAPGTLAAVCLATWLRCSSAAVAHV